MPQILVNRTTGQWLRSELCLLIEAGYSRACTAAQGEINFNNYPFSLICFSDSLITNLKQVLQQRMQCLVSRKAANQRSHPKFQNRANIRFSPKLFIFCSKIWTKMLKMPYNSDQTSCRERKLLLKKGMKTVKLKGSLRENILSVDTFCF